MAKKIIEWDIPLHSYQMKSTNIPLRIYLWHGVKVPGAAPSLRMKQSTWLFLRQQGLNKNKLESQLHYLIMYPKYKQLTGKFTSATSREQIQIYYHFQQLLQYDWKEINKWKQNTK